MFEIPITGQAWSRRPSFSPLELAQRAHAKQESDSGFSIAPMMADKGSYYLRRAANSADAHRRDVRISALPHALSAITAPKNNENDGRAWARIPRVQMIFSGTTFGGRRDWDAQWADKQ